MNENNLDDLLSIEKELKEKLLCVQGKITEVKLKSLQLETGLKVGSIVSRKHDDQKFKVGSLKVLSKYSTQVNGYKQRKNGEFSKLSQFIGFAGDYGDVEVVE